jgi:hypothetical protein
MRQNDTTAPTATAAANTLRRRLKASARARLKKPPAASPDEKEQFFVHWPLTTNGGV